VLFSRTDEAPSTCSPRGTVTGTAGAAGQGAYSEYHARTIGRCLEIASMALGRVSGGSLLAASPHFRTDRSSLGGGVSVWWGNLGGRRN
jgi:hypothetical protein